MASRSSRSRASFSFAAWQETSHCEHACLGAAVFCRAFGLCITYFALVTLPGHFNLLQSTVVAFPYAPWHHLHLPPSSPVALGWLRRVLIASGAGILLGVYPRACLCVSFAVVTYTTQLDRTFYNNHYVLLQLLCLMLLAVDRRCLAWRPWLRLLSRGTQAVPPVLLRWQLTSLRLLLLTPYAYGAVAKLNYSWLLHAQPVSSWADDMLTKLDALVGGLLSASIDKWLSPETDVVGPFSYLICIGGLVLDAWLPWALMFARGRATRVCAIAACVAFNAANKLWFGLGIFPWLNVCALSLFLEPPMRSRTVTWQVKPPPRSRGRLWPLRLTMAMAVPFALVPLRGLLWYSYERSGLWSDEGQLYAWHMKLVEREGVLVLKVTGRVPPPSPAPPSPPPPSSPSATWDTWHLVPETDTALHPDQAGELPHNPSMLLTYAAHVAGLFSRRGIRNVSVTSLLSCVSVNGRRAQPLYLSHVNLVEYSGVYASLRAEWTGYSGVGRFLHPWHSAGRSASMAHLRSSPSVAHGCALREPPPHQRESDATYRWLYADLYSRPSKADWPWQGRTRMPPAAEPRGYETAESCASRDAPSTQSTAPSWARSCSYLHAADSMWCPEDAQT